MRFLISLMPSIGDDMRRGKVVGLITGATCRPRACLSEFSLPTTIPMLPPAPPDKTYGPGVSLTAWISCRSPQYGIPLEKLPDK